MKWLHTLTWRKFEWWFWFVIAVFGFVAMFAIPYAGLEPRTYESEMVNKCHRTTIQHLSVTEVLQCEKWLAER